MVTKGKQSGGKRRATGQKRSAKHSNATTRKLPRGIEILPCDYGRGVFATRIFPAESLVGEVFGEIITDPEYGSQNCMDLGRYGVLEPDVPFQCLNHSCEPNCELLWELDSRRPRVYVQTIRPIAPGEQLTLDYAWPAEEAIPCQCQSALCRGWVVAEDQRHLLPTSMAV